MPTRGLRCLLLYSYIHLRSFTLTLAEESNASTRGCPGGLDDIQGKAGCGIDLKEIASDQGLLKVATLSLDESGAIEHVNSSLKFKSLWYRAGSDAKVAFDTTGNFDLPEQFMSEFEEAMRDEGLFQDGSDVVRGDLIYLYPDPESAAGGATVSFLDDSLKSLSARSSWGDSSAHPESSAWENFARFLVFKSQCVSEQITLDRPKAEQYFDSARYLLKEYSFSCGVELEARLVAQMQATNLAMRMMFAQISSLGRCLYPCADCGDGQFKNRKHCAKLVLQPMVLADDGRLGLISLAISFATAYGKVADGIANPKFATYKDSVEKIFGCTYESGLEINLVETIRKIHRKKIRADRAYTCRTVIAHHRAFERTFLRFVAAIKAWMQTFSRNKKSGIFSYPCAHVFGDPFGENSDFCEREAFLEADGMPIDESSPCEKSGVTE